MNIESASSEELLINQMSFENETLYRSLFLWDALSESKLEPR